jgi:phosphoribosylglycinamide formyltransferase-1
MDDRRASIGVLISGRGSNLQALIDAVRGGVLRAEIRVVISNREDAAGLDRARRAGIEAVWMPHDHYPSRAAYDQALVSALGERGVQLVCLAGFMRLLGPGFSAAFPRAVLNVHPSLLPSFPGVNAQLQALQHGVKVTGATVHFVTPELDAGPIVSQRVVEVRDDDTVEALASRVLDAEHAIYPSAVARVLAGGWRVVGRRVVFDRSVDPSGRQQSS